MDGWSVFIEFVHYHWLSRTPCSCTPPFYAVGSITIYIVSSYLRLCSCQILTLNSSTLAYFFFNSYCTAGCPARSLLPFTEFFKVTLLFSSFTSLNLICYPHLTYCFYKLYFSREHTHIYIYDTQITFPPVSCTFTLQNLTPCYLSANCVSVSPDSFWSYSAAMSYPAPHYTSFSLHTYFCLRIFVGLFSDVGVDYRVNERLSQFIYHFTTSFILLI